MIKRFIIYFLIGMLCGNFPFVGVVFYFGTLSIALTSLILSFIRPLIKSNLLFLITSYVISWISILFEIIYKFKPTELGNQLLDVFYLFFVFGNISVILYSIIISRIPIEKESEI